MDAPNNEVKRWMADYVDELHRPDEIERLVTLVDDAVIAAVPEVATDEELRSRLHASTRAHLRGFLSTVGLDSFEMSPPGDVLAWPRTIARRGLDLAALLKSYLVGQRFVWRYVTTTLGEQIRDPELRAAVLVQFWDLTTNWVHTSLEAVVLAYIDEREQWQRGAVARRAETVHAILRGETVDTDQAAIVLGHSLHLHQTAFAIWTDDPNMEANPIRALEAVARELAAALDGSSPLILPSATHGLWVWIATPQQPDLEALTDISGLGTTIRATVGSTAAGTIGFRRSHREAVAAQRVAMNAHRTRPLTSYADVELVCLTTGDGTVEAMRTLVERELGSLAEPGDTAARLRETVRLFLGNGSDIHAVARALNVHQNTVRYRVQQAERLLGHPIDERRVYLELALRSVEVYGDQLLPPAPSAPGS